jgi:hypothetical protein
MFVTNTTTKTICLSNFLSLLTGAYGICETSPSSTIVGQSLSKTQSSFLFRAKCRQQRFCPVLFHFSLCNSSFFPGWGRWPHAQPPTWRTRVSLLVWNLTLDLSGLGDPTSSYATAGIAPEIIGNRKPHRHDKAGTPP